MIKWISAACMAFGLLALNTASQANPANPTNGHCQTVDPAACGWGGNSAPRAPVYWFFALAFDEDTGAWSTGYGASKKLAIRYARENCRKNNIKDESSLFGSNKSCDFNYTWGGDTTNKNISTVYMRAQNAQGKYRFDIRYNGSYRGMKASLLEDCPGHQLNNCEIVGQQ